MSRNLVRLSKFLALILRHQPQKVGLTLDENGWADIDELIRCCDQHGTKFTKDILNQIVSSDDKQRYKISDDGTKIRANQGHSVQVDLQLQPTTPPALLYHGTAERFINSIMQQGLKPQSRQYVHLSTDIETATKVGSRHGKVAILEVDSARMQADGNLFYISENGVWLTDHVPSTYLKRI